MRIKIFSCLTGEDEGLKLLEKKINKFLNLKGITVQNIMSNIVGYKSGNLEKREVFYTVFYDGTVKSSEMEAVDKINPDKNGQGK